MATYTPVQITNAGVAESLTAVGSSDTFAYPANAICVWMEVNNADASGNTVTVTSEATPGDGEAKSNKSVVVAASTRQKFRISEAFKDANGDVAVAHSNTTSNTAGVFYI